MFCFNDVNRKYPVKNRRLTLKAGHRCQNPSKKKCSHLNNDSALIVFPVHVHFGCNRIGLDSH